MADTTGVDASQIEPHHDKCNAARTDPYWRSRIISVCISIAHAAAATIADHSSSSAAARPSLFVDACGRGRSCTAERQRDRGACRHLSRVCGAFAAPWPEEVALRSSSTGEPLT
jgi:hypothetical protein